MWFLYVIIGLILGFGFGVVAAAWCQVEADRKSIKTGIIKLCGRFFRLTEIDV